MWLWNSKVTFTHLIFISAVFTHFAGESATLAFIHPVKLRHQTKLPREHPQNEFFICSRAPPLQHAALLITVLISVGFPRAEE